MRLRPVRAIPSPRVVEEPERILTAEKNHLPPSRVVGHHRPFARGGGGRRGTLAPRGAVPSPCVADLGRAIVAAEQHDTLVGLIVRHPWPRSGGRSSQSTAMRPGVLGGPPRSGEDADQGRHRTKDRGRLQVLHATSLHPSSMSNARTIDPPDPFRGEARTVIPP